MSKGVVLLERARDKRLVKRLLAGDARSFDEFFDRYFPGLYRFALSRTQGNADVAEEVVQATLCKAVTKLDSYRGEAALFTWLCTFCRHEISAIYRTRSKHQAESIDDNPRIHAILESLTTEFEQMPDEALRRKEMASLVQATLDYLPQRYGDALQWKYMDGESVAEIATRLGLSCKAAESMLTRARNAFRDGFAAVCEGWADTLRDAKRGTS